MANRKTELKKGQLAAHEAIKNAQYEKKHKGRVPMRWVGETEAEYESRLNADKEREVILPRKYGESDETYRKRNATHNKAYDTMYNSLNDRHLPSKQKAIDKSKKESLTSLAKKGFDSAW